MENKFISNYHAFYNMVLITTMLSNVADDLFDQDASKIIRLIGEAYHYDEEAIEACIKIITDDLVAISIMQDAASYTLAQNYDTENSELNNLFGIKCDVLGVISSIKAEAIADFNLGWFDYTHYKPYCPEIRYAQIEKTATSGNSITNKAAAIMLYLGIGVEKDVASSILRLKQCALWGDMFAVNVLAYILEQEKEPEYEMYSELAKLEHYFNEGRTLLPTNVQNEVKQETRELFACISSIKQDIVLSYNLVNIDYSFIEVMLLKNVDYYKKLYFINNYRREEWKEVTNSSINPNSGMGFKTGRKE